MITRAISIILAIQVQCGGGGGGRWGDGVEMGQPHMVVVVMGMVVKAINISQSILEQCMAGKMVMVVVMKVVVVMVVVVMWWWLWK